MRTIHRAAIAGSIAALTILAAGVPANAAPAEDSPSALNSMLAQTRAAVAAFHDVEAAVDAGYVLVSECAESPDGAMGYHYLNPEYVQIGTVDPSRPPMLTYGPSASGGLELWSAEYWEPFIGQDAPKYGSQPFDGPMPGHDAQMPVHYDLHIWVGKHNPSGMFAPFNPSLHC